MWTAAYRQKATLRDDDRDNVDVGPFTQVSRLGNPLFNEVLVPLATQGRVEPQGTAPRLRVRPVRGPAGAGRLLPFLYPGVFPNLAAYNKDRADLLAILLTGIPGGIVPGFQNFTGATQADLLRLNVAIPPSANPNVNGILGGDLAGFPNGRRVFDDIVTVELRAVAGLTIPLVDDTFTPDGAAGLINDGTQVLGDVTYLDRVPVPRPPGQRLRRAAAVRGRVVTDHHASRRSPHHAGRWRPLARWRSLARSPNGPTPIMPTAAPPCSTSVATSVRSSCCSIPAPRGPSCTCGRQARPTGRSTPACGSGTRAAVTSRRRCSPSSRTGTWFVLDDHGDDVTP